jgi:hypothetical protein
MDRPASSGRFLRGGRLAVLAPLLGIGVLLAGCYYVVPAPPPYAAPVPGPPPPGVVYVPGQWVWTGAAWVWRPPYWAASPGPAPPPAAVPPAAAPPPPGSPPQAPKS